MDSKAELLVFNKKEILVIIVLLVLVALFSFTLGLKLGKTLGAAAKPEHAEMAPLAHDESHVAPAPSHEQTDNEHAQGEHGSDQAAENKPAEPNDDPAAHAEDKADAELVKEAAHEKVGPGKVRALTLPPEKKTDGRAGARFTLQVGSHRTVAEAAEQVSLLKKKGLDAFYLEAKVPGKGTWYRVGIGVFGTREQADRATVEWKDKGLPSFIVQKLGE